MRQLPLQISAPAEPRFENYLAGVNVEALARVRALAAGSLHEAIVYLWGEPGSGRTHLLRAAAHANPELFIADDVETLDSVAQQALFVAINAARDGQAAVLAAGTAPPAQLPLRVRRQRAGGCVSNGFSIKMRTRWPVRSASRRTTPPSVIVAIPCTTAFSTRG